MLSRIRAGPTGEPTKDRRKRAKARALFADSGPERFCRTVAGAAAGGRSPSAPKGERGFYSMREEAAYKEQRGPRKGACLLHLTRSNGLYFI
jgi:hypothetical protein